MQERQRFSVEILPILGKPSAAIEPSNGALDDPSVGQNFKALRRVGTLDDFNVEMRQNLSKHFRKFRPLISAIGEQRLQKWKHAEQCRHDENASIAILNVGRMNDGMEQEVGTVGEEELGNLRGVKALFRDHADIDGFISIDGLGITRVVNQATGSHRYEMIFKGPGG